MVLVHLLADFSHLVHQHEGASDQGGPQDIGEGVDRPVDLTPVPHFVEPGQVVVDGVRHGGNAACFFGAEAGKGIRCFVIGRGYMR